MRKTIAGIISYKGRNFLPECINSCLQSNIDILVIDNNSSDGSFEYLSSLNTLNLIKNESNLGFTKAVNQSIEYALNKGYSYLLLLNQDTEFDEKMVSQLLKSFEENPSLAIVSPLQLNEDKQPEYQFKLNCDYFGIDLDLSKSETIDVPFVNAACWLMDLRKVKQVGNLYPIFNNYGSDLNYCHRVIHTGYKVGINIQAKVIHKKKDRDYQNSFLKTIKNHNTFYLALLLNPQVTVSLKNTLFILAKGSFGFLFKFNFKKALLNTITFFFLLQRLSVIRMIKSTKKS